MDEVNERSLIMRKILLIVAVVGMSVSAQASYLYWQVTDTIAADDDAGLKPIISQGTSGDYITRFRYGNTAAGTSFENFSVYSDTDGDILGTVGNPESLSPVGGAVKVDLSTIATDPTTYSYYVEVLKWDSANKAYTQVAVSDLQSYSDLFQQGYIGAEDSLIDIPSIKVWAGTSYAAPEPTGGMLVMMGLAFLGLKRRRT